ncbi:hypothetical protein D6833_06495, partial [Candidatus Parcubacteria bacterium]
MDGSVLSQRLWRPVALGFLLLGLLTGRGHTIPAQTATLTLAYPTWFRDYPVYRRRYIPRFEQYMRARGTPVRVRFVALPAGDQAYRKALVLRLY